MKRVLLTVAEFYIIICEPSNTPGLTDLTGEPVTILPFPTSPPTSIVIYESLTPAKFTLLKLPCYWDYVSTYLGDLLDIYPFTYPDSLCFSINT